MKKIFLFISMGVLGYANSHAQSKFLFVHNSPDPAVEVVDVWVESMVGYNKYAEDLSYQQAYFLDIPAAVPGAVTIHFKDGGSTASSDADVFTKQLAALPSGDNIVVFTGLMTSSLLADKTNPDAVSNALDVIVESRALSSSDPAQVSLSVFQGAVDLNSVYLHSFITTIQSAPRDTLASGLLYKETSASVASVAGSRRIHITPTGQAQTSALYPSNGDVQKSWGGKAALLVVSGFADTTGTGTSNNLKVLAYVTDASAATGALSPVELPKEKIAGVVQVYHNSPDPSLKNVDLYVGGIKQVLGLEFRKGFQSAGFIQDFDYIIGLHATGSSTAVLSSTMRFDSDSVVAVLQGVDNPANFVANPDGESIALVFVQKEPALLTQPAGSTQITVFHGAPDAPTLDITVPAVGGLALVSDLKYGNYQEAQGTSGTSIPTALGTAVIDVKKPDGSVYKSYLVPLATFDGQAVTALVSGFVDSAANQNGESFALFIGVSNSPFPQIIPLKDTSLITSINDPSVADMYFRMFPNPAQNDLVMAFDVKDAGKVSIDILDISGRVVKTVTNTEYGKGKVALTEDIRSLQSGTYITRVTSANKTSTYKFNVIR